MPDEQRPLRQLSRIEKLLVKLGRCPTCRRKLISISHEEIKSWHNNPAGFRVPVGRAGYGSHDGMQTGNITQLSHQKIPHCAGCQHTFVHGWIYPATK